MSSESISSEENKAIVQRLVEEVVNQGTLEVADELFAPECILHDPIVGTSSSGWNSSQVKAIVGMLRTAFPDIGVIITAQEAAGDDNHIITEWAANGTNTGPFEVVLTDEQRVAEPKGEYMETAGVIISRFIDRRIAELWLVNGPVESPAPLGIRDWCCKHCRLCC